MNEHTFTFGNWRSRLGFKGGKVPPILPGVQPVQVVGDASLLVPHMLPPTALYGGSITSAVAHYPHLSIRSLAAGGTLIKDTHFMFADAGYLTVGLSTTDVTWNTSDVKSGHQMTSEDTVSIVTIGDAAAAKIPLVDNPTIKTIAALPQGVPGDILIPRGEFLIFCHSAANTLMEVYFALQDLPASPGPQ